MHFAGTQPHQIVHSSPPPTTTAGTQIAAHMINITHTLSEHLLCHLCHCIDHLVKNYTIFTNSTGVCSKHTCGVMSYAMVSITDIADSQPNFSPPPTTTADDATMQASGGAAPAEGQMAGGCRRRLYGYILGVVRCTLCMCTNTIFSLSFLLLLSYHSVSLSFITAQVPRKISSSTSLTNADNASHLTWVIKRTELAKLCSNMRGPIKCCKRLVAKVPSRRKPELGLFLDSHGQVVDGRKHIKLEAPIYLSSRCSKFCLEVTTVRLTIRVIDGRSEQIVVERCTSDFKLLQQRSVSICGLLAHDTIHSADTPTFRLEALVEVFWGHECPEVEFEVIKDVVNVKRVA